MNRVGIYPGTFDPITNGHIDVINRSLKIVDKLIIAVSNVYSKDYLFSAEERVTIIKNSLFKDLKFKTQRLKILSFNSLTTTLCSKHHATIIFRGLRAVSDFEYEFQLAGMNRQLNNKIETVFLMSDPDKQVISSKFVKEIAKLKGKISNFVTKSTEKEIKDTRFMYERLTEKFGEAYLYDGLQTYEYMSFFVKTDDEKFIIYFINILIIV